MTYSNWEGSSSIWGNLDTTKTHECLHCGAKYESISYRAGLCPKCLREWLREHQEAEVIA